MTIRPVGPRHRVLKARVAAAVATHPEPVAAAFSVQPQALKVSSEGTTEKVAAEEPLKPVTVTLHSQQVPTIPVGTYNVEIEHNFAFKSKADQKELENRTIKTSKSLKVVAPQLSLGDGAVHSMYPPPGTEVSCDVLPHVVLHDPFLPWARNLNLVSEQATQNVKPAMPWLCLMLFDPSELILEDEELYGPPGDLAGSLIPSVTGAKGFDKLKWIQSTSYSLRASLSKLRDSQTKIQTPFWPNSPYQGLNDEEQFSFIAPKRATVEKLLPWDDPSNDYYAFLSHAREVDVTNMPDVFSTTELDEEDKNLSTFSVIISPRCGNLDITEPSTVAAHLVSLESVQAIYDSRASKDKSSDRVALVSLHSWTYSCTPLGSVSFFDTMKQLGEGMQRLQAPEKVIEDLIKSETLLSASQLREKSWLAGRLKDGFTFVRHRLANGDVTTSMYRSALTPSVVPHPLILSEEDSFPRMASFGSDLQIIDRQTGLADVTYNLAWELGRNLAMAHKSFSTSLLRIRNAIHAIAIKDASTRVLGDVYVSRRSILEGLGKLSEKVQPSLTSIEDVSSPRWVHGRTHAGLSTRRSWTKFSSPGMEDVLPESFAKAAAEVASHVHEGEQLPTYAEGRLPTNPDWPIVLDWLVDKMFLKDIPPQYLFPDVSHLPPESLRTFHIDHNWIDSLLDGALSIVNRFDQHDGYIRDAIKQELNEYLSTEVDKKPFPVPCWGFLMRSAAVSAFPNLEIKASGNRDNNGNKAFQAAKVIHNVIGDDLMLCIFDRGPSAGNFKEGFTIAQPMHQQFYHVGDVGRTGADGLHITMPVTVPGNLEPGDRVDIRIERSLVTLSSRNNTETLSDGIPFNFDTRMFNLPELNKILTEAYKLLPAQSNLPTDQDARGVTSAMIGDLLSDKPFKLEIDDADQNEDVTEEAYREVFARRRPTKASAAPQKQAAQAAPKQDVILKAARQMPTVTQTSQPAISTAATQASSATTTIPGQADTPPPKQQLSVTSMNSEDFGPDFKFPDAIFSIEAENVQKRKWFFNNTPNSANAYAWSPDRGSDPSTIRSIFVPASKPSQPVCRTSLLIRPLVKPGPICLNKLTLRIPVGRVQRSGNYAIPLFDHSQLSTPIAPSVNVMGSRWMCRTSYETDEEEPGRDFYVITVVPRVGVSPLFGWPVRDIESIQILLPPLHMIPQDDQGESYSAYPRYLNQTFYAWVAKVGIKVEQEYTWNERVFWEAVGQRTERMEIVKVLSSGYFWEQS